MSDNNQPVEKHGEKADRSRKQNVVPRVATGIGGGLVGAAIGGLLGRRVGGAVGGVVGTVAGALVGKGTAQTVNRTVEGVVGAAKTVADAVHHSVNGVGDALKDTVEQVTPSVVGVVDTVKDTFDRVKPSVVSAVDTVKDTVDTVKGTVDRVKPSVVTAVDTVKDTVEQVKPYVVDTAQDVAVVVYQSVNDVANTVKDTVEQVKSSVVGVEDIEDTEKITPPEVTPSVVPLVVSESENIPTAFPSNVNNEKFLAKETPEDVQPQESVESKVEAVQETVELVNASKSDIANAVEQTPEEVEEVQPQESVKGTDNNETEGVNSCVNNAEKSTADTVEDVKPPVISAEDAPKALPENTRPSVGDNFQNFVEVINHTINGVGNVVEVTPNEFSPFVVDVKNTVKATPKDVQPSLIAVENVEKVVHEEKPANLNTKLSEEHKVKVQLLKPIEHPPSDDVQEQVGQRLNDLQQANNARETTENQKNQQRQEDFQQLQHQRIQPKTEQKRSFSGIGEFIAGVGIITLVGAIAGFIPKQNLFATKAPEPSQNINQISSTTLSEVSQNINQASPTTPSPIFSNPDGWIFLGNVNNASNTALVGKPLLQNSQSTDSRVVPSVGEIVTVIVTPGVTLRENRPQAPNFSHKEQKAVSVLKPKEKLKILQVEFVPPPSPTQKTTKVWAKVDRCGMGCP
ncbi:hypothetical protein NUACC21_20730 [Scytonema sp. NUACC21]